MGFLVADGETIFGDGGFGTFKILPRPGTAISWLKPPGFDGPFE